MRRVTFTFQERLELIPVEFGHLTKTTLYLVPALFLLSGVGQGIFSVGTAFSRGAMALMTYLLAIASGVALAPAILPWLPGRAFSVKGAIRIAVLDAALAPSYARMGCSS